MTNQTPSPPAGVLTVVSAALRLFFAVLAGLNAVEPVRFVLTGAMQSSVPLLLVHVGATVLTGWLAFRAPWTDEWPWPSDGERR